jgi:hypothetical protein
MLEHLHNLAKTFDNLDIIMDDPEKVALWFQAAGFETWHHNTISSRVIKRWRRDRKLPFFQERRSHGRMWTTQQLLVAYMVTRTGRVPWVKRGTHTHRRT